MQVHKQFYCPATEIQNVSKTPLESFNNNQMIRFSLRFSDEF